MAAQRTYLNTILLLSAESVKKFVMLNVLENFTIMILLMNRGLAGSVTLLKNADITHLNRIDMINTLSLIVIAFQKFIKLKIYLKIVIHMTYMN